MTEHNEEYEDAFRVALSRWKAFLQTDDSDDKYEYILSQWIDAASAFQVLGGNVFEVMNA